MGHAAGSDYDALALITDGLENLALKMPEREAFLGFWNPMLNDLAHTDEPEAVPERLLSFISGERVQSRTGDDVTIAIAVPQPPERLQEEPTMTIRDTVGVYDQTEFADNPEARCSIVFILDVSGSMAGRQD